MVMGYISFVRSILQYIAEQRIETEIGYEKNKCIDSLL